VKKLIITGTSGMLGSNLAITAKDDYEIYGLDLAPLNNNIPNQIKIDLTDLERVNKVIKEIGPDYIVHCAAMTDVNLCEEMPESARSANALATRILARVGGEKAKFIYISTAAIFDGKKGAYKEDDATAPVNIYAKTKLEGEGFVEEYAKNNIIIRTDIIGWKRKQYFVQVIFDTLSNNETVRGYVDAYFSPISSYSMAKCIRKLLNTDFCGKLHIGSKDQISKYDFSLGFAKTFGFDEKLVIKGSANDGSGASRPMNSSLNVSKAMNILKELNTAAQEISVLAKAKGR